MKSNGPMSGAGGAVAAKAAQADRPAERSGHRNVGSVGSERPASPKVVQEGGSAAEAKGLKASLSTAVGHLHSEHPKAHNDRGPHHGGSDHIRHAPAVGPNKGHPWQG